MKYAKERRQFGKAIAEFGLIKQKLAEHGDSRLRRRRDGRIARSATSIARSRRSIPPTARRVLKTIEGFAVECSINKVWTSEALAWAVDEALQVFGGNGYSREFPLERSTATRASRASTKARTRSTGCSSRRGC